MIKLSEKGVEGLKSVAQRHIDAGLVPSCQYALALDGEVLVNETLGSAPKIARYLVMSATKPVFASVVWQLMGEGILDPAAPVVDLWPEFGKHGKDKVTLEHLLLHTAGFPFRVLDYATIGDRALRVAQMEEWEAEWEPGTAFAYHGHSAYHVMAELVERATGRDWRIALRQRVLDPMGLDRLELGVPVERQVDLMPLVHTDDGNPGSDQEWQDVLGLSGIPEALLALINSGGTGPASDANMKDGLYTYRLPHVVAAGLPGANAVSDAASMAMFYQHLLHDPKGIFDPAILHDVTTNVRNRMPGPPTNTIANRTLGLELQGDEFGVRLRTGYGVAPPYTFGHGGATGQIGLADPASGLSFAYLQNGDDLSPVRTFGLRARELTAAAFACLS